MLFSNLALKLEPAALPTVPPGWWVAFLRLCLRELPAYGVDILVRGGMETAAVQALCALSDEDFEAWLVTVGE